MEFKKMFWMVGAKPKIQFVYVNVNIFSVYIEVPPSAPRFWSVWQRYPPCIVRHRGMDMYNLQRSACLMKIFEVPPILTAISSVTHKWKRANRGTKVLGKMVR